MLSRVLARRLLPAFRGMATLKMDKPMYRLTFTCKKCDERSSHQVSKQAYHSGTVLIQCPTCTNRHLIADHLNIFGQGKRSFEDILGDAGQTLTTKKVYETGDLQWEPGNDEPECVPALEGDK